MSHNILTRDVQVGTTQAWHGLTTIEPKITREVSRICYGMEIVPLYIKTADGTEIQTDHRQIISLDDNLPIGNAVGDGYSLISNSRVWDMMEEALKGTRHEVVSCGTVDDRSKGFITVKLEESFMAASRNTEPLFNILWGHGGNIALIARSSFIVTVCANTFAMNLGRKGKDLNLTNRHTKNAIARMDNMAKALDAYAGITAEFKNAMDSFESVDCDEENARKIFGGILVPATFETKNEVSTRTANTIDRLVQLYQGGAGNGGRNNADVFNAVTDYFTHESSGGEDRMKQFVSSEFGSGQTVKEEFFDILSNESELAKVKTRGEKVLLALAS